MEEFNNDTLREILGEADEIFHFNLNVRPQDRAHAYLGRHELMRNHKDTAMQVAVRDMIYRSFAAGLAQNSSHADIEALKEVAVALGDAYEGLMEVIGEE